MATPESWLSPNPLNLAATCAACVNVSGTLTVDEPTGTTDDVVGGPRRLPDRKLARCAPGFGTLVEFGPAPRCAVLIDGDRNGSAPYAARVNDSAFVAAGELTDQTDDVADRLRRVSERKLTKSSRRYGEAVAKVRAGIMPDPMTLDERARAAGGPREATLADLARAVAGRLVEVAQGIDERDAPTEPVWRPMPDAGPLAVGDQIAVAGAEVSRALCALPDAPGAAAGAGYGSFADPSAGGADPAWPGTDPALAARGNEVLNLPIWTRGGRQPLVFALGELTFAVSLLGGQRELG
jgi:hypothetical protein